MSGFFTREITRIEKNVMKQDENKRMKKSAVIRYFKGKMKQDEVTEKNLRSSPNNEVTR